MEGRINEADGCLLSALTAGDSEGASREAFAEAALFGTNRRCLKSPVQPVRKDRRRPHAGACPELVEGIRAGAAGKPAVLPRSRF